MKYFSYIYSIKESVMKKLFLVFSFIVSSFTFSQNIDNKSIEFEVIKLINAYRVANGFNALQYNSQLYQAAQLQSKYMSANNTVTHYNNAVGLNTPQQRIDNFKKSWTVLTTAENCNNVSISLNNSNNVKHAFEIFNRWKNSPGHNANMLIPDINQIAVSISINSDLIYSCMTVCLDIK
jgi:uncharacterized protein YkwD